MATKKFSTLGSPDGTDYLDDIRDSERRTRPRSPKLTKAPSLDAEKPNGVLDLARPDAAMPSNVPSVDAGNGLVVHNAFWVAGKVPSLNELIDAKGTKAPIIRSIIMRSKPVKGQGGGRFDLYNDIKQDWTARTVRAVSSPFVRCVSAYFGYVIVEATLKRDPSNVSSAAIKFIEDGLIKAGVIPNDGWTNVLGIRHVCIHRAHRPPGVYVVMSDRPMPETDLVARYEARPHHE